ncbi:MAG: Fic family protein [Thermoplasmatota archaeon]
MRNTWRAGGIAYHEDASTIVRQPQRSFEPTYRLTKRLQEVVRTLERCDQDLLHFVADDATSHRLLRDALTRNAFGTASIEGNPMTLEEVQSLLAAGPTPEKVTQPDEREILNIADFLEHLEDAAFPASVADLCALHRRLFAGVLKDPGKLKVKSNFIGSRRDRTVVFVPTPPERVKKELEDLLTWHTDSEEHPAVKAALFFHEFQSIHPFPDGNGRLGRALATLSLWYAGYPGVRYALVDYAINNDRQNYYESLQDARAKNDLTVWLDFFLPLLAESFQDAVRHFLFAKSLPRNLGDRPVRVAEVAARLDRSNPGRRFKLADLHAVLPQIPLRTLQLDLRRLVEAGILEREGERKAATYRLTFDEPRGALSKGTNLTAEGLAKGSPAPRSRSAPNRRE